MLGSGTVLGTDDAEQAYTSVGMVWPQAGEQQFSGFPQDDPSAPAIGQFAPQQVLPIAQRG